MRALNSRRRGHLEFLLLIMIVSLICSLVQIALLDGPCKESAWWVKLLILQCNPAVLMLELIVAVWAPIWAFFLLEGGASYIGVGVFQYSKERVLGIPAWLFDRSWLLGVGVLVAGIVLGLRGWNLDIALALSFWEIQGVGLLVFAFTVVASWIVALARSGGSFEPIFEACLAELPGARYQ